MAPALSLVRQRARRRECALTGTRGWHILEVPDGSGDKGEYLIWKERMHGIRKIGRAHV